jgi:GAF domain-containing protein
MTVTFDVQVLCGRLDRFEISRDEFIEACTRLMARAIGCSRAGIWLVDEGRHGPLFRCLGLYDQTEDRMSLLAATRKVYAPAYFDALDQVGYVMADDARLNPATAELFDTESNPSPVRSLLAAAFRFNGQLYGAFSCAEVHRQTHWTRAQLVALMRIGSRATLALSGASQTRQSTFPMPLM